MGEENPSAPRKPRKSRHGSRLATVTLVLGSLAAVLGHVAEIKKALFELVGPDLLQSLHVGASVVIAILFVVGYSALGWWLWHRFLSGRKADWARAGIAAVMLAGLAVTGCSIYIALPPEPNVQALLATEMDAWARELAGLRKGDGVLRTDRRDPSSMEQVWNTAQALNALLLPPASPTANPRDLRGLLDAIDALQIKDSDGKEGWGYYNKFSWGVTEIAGWVVLAEVRALREDWAKTVWATDREIGKLRLQLHTELLLSRQLESGAFTPIKEQDDDDARTYSTIMALWALIEVERAELCADCRKVESAIRSGVTWLLRSYESDAAGWVPRPARGGNLDSYPGLTAQTLYVLERARPLVGDLLQAEYVNYRRRFFKSIETAEDSARPALIKRAARSNDRTHDGDVALHGKAVLLEGSTFLWLPWTLAVCTTQREMQASKEDVDLVAGACRRIGGRVNDLIRFAKSEVFVYVMAESLLALRLQAAANASGG